MFKRIQLRVEQHSMLQQTGYTRKQKPVHRQTLIQWGHTVTIQTSSNRYQGTTPKMHRDLNSVYSNQT